ncbi:unnamed protein product, partial [Rotaria magnacalcarata]
MMRSGTGSNNPEEDDICGNCQTPHGNRARRPEGIQLVGMGSDGREYIVATERHQLDQNARRGSGRGAAQCMTYSDAETQEVSIVHDPRYEKIVPRDQRQVSYPWRYTSSSNAKSLHSIEDAERYIIALAEIWKIRSSS